MLQKTSQRTIRKQKEREQKRLKAANGYAKGTVISRVTMIPYASFSQAGLDYLKFHKTLRFFQKK